MKDADWLRTLVDDGTFRRGLYYADHGAVIALHRVSGGRISGTVRGNSPTPYSVMVELEPGHFEGSCSCPVAIDCKHAVALAILALRRDGADEADDWKSVLAGLFEEQVDDAQPPLALQFDLKGAEEPGGASIELRPVVPGLGGGWVRTGVSWTSLTHNYYRWETPGSREASPRFKAGAQLLGEILAMSGRASYAPSGTPIHLQDVPSRRIWLLLAEAARVGVPLVGPGKTPLPVVLSPPAMLGLDLSLDSEDLLLRPRLTLGDEEIVADGVRLLGETPHGVAWWTFLKKKPQLTVAPLEGVRDDVVSAVAARGQLRVPKDEIDAFTGRYLPRLQRQVVVGSRDRSFTPAPPEPPVLVLRLSHVTAGGLRLRWVWRYAGREFPLQAEAPHDDHDATAEAAILSAVEKRARVVPGVFVEGVLVADATFTGYDAVRFRAEVLSQLQALSGVEVDIDPSLPDYREAMSHPLVRATVEPKDDDWYDLAVSVDIDDERVPFEHLFIALSRGRSHLLLPSGTFFALNTPALSALTLLIAESQGLEDPDRKPLTISRYRPDTWADLIFHGILDGQAAEWRNRVRRWMNRCSRLRFRPPCRRPCGPIRKRVSGGWPSGLSAASAVSSLMRWDWARRSRRSR